MNSGNGGDRSQKQAVGLRGWARRLLLLALALMGISIVQVAVLRFVNPPFSSFMAIRLAEAWSGGDTRFRIAYDWRDLEQMSPNVPVALVAAEDQKFAEHYGFDLDAIEKAQQHNAHGKRIRGGSTISQQTAKNLFLWGGRSWVRKGIEAWYTFLMEAMWPKERILEVYANVAEFGDGVYGAQAAARTFYRTDASRLSAAQAARMAAVLPNPRRYHVADPGPYVQRRANAIQRQMGYIGGRHYLDAIE